jgi:quinol monooxygenase YgiN
MMFTAIALHYAAPEHEAAFLAYMARVIAATAGAPGLREFRAYRDTQSGALAGFSRWDDEASFRAALATIGSLAAERRPEWSTAPDRLLTLVEA